MGSIAGHRREESKPVHGEAEEERVESQKRLRDKTALEANQDGVFVAERNGTGCLNRAGKSPGCELPVSATMTANTV